MFCSSWATSDWQLFMLCCLAVAAAAVPAAGAAASGCCCCCSCWLLLLLLVAAAAGWWLLKWRHCCCKAMLLQRHAWMLEHQGWAFKPWPAKRDLSISIQISRYDSSFQISYSARPAQLARSISSGQLSYLQKARQGCPLLNIYFEIRLQNLLFSATPTPKQVLFRWISSINTNDEKHTGFIMLCLS